MTNLRELLPALFVGPGGRPLTEEEIARRREVAGSLLGQATDTSPNAGGMTSVLAKAIQGLSYGVNEGRMDRAAGENAARSQARIQQMLGGMGQAVDGVAPVNPGTTSSMATMPAPDAASMRVAQAHGGSGFLPQSMLDVLDRVEGGGDYDTLFGFANRDGNKFSGTSVSNMTVADALAFSDPSGPYAQHVKAQIGRVATPMGRHQIVGTTLRNAIQQMGIDPQTPFNQETQDRIALHLAQQRLASASTESGKIAALRNEWEGFKHVPDTQLRQIIRDLEAMPAGGFQPDQAVSSGMTGADVAASYGRMAPGAFGAPVQPVDRAPLPAIDPAVAEVLVAESPEDILAAEAALGMDGTGRGDRLAPSEPDPARFGDSPRGDRLPVAAPTADPVAVDPVAQALVAPAADGATVAPVQDISTAADPVAQALTAYAVDPDLPMRGTMANSGFAQPSPAAAPMGINPAVIEALADPSASAQEKQIAGMLYQQYMDSQDPYKQLQRQKLELEVAGLRNPQAERERLINVGGGVLYDPNDERWITAPNAGQPEPGFRMATPEEAAQYGSAAGQFGPDGRFYPINPPSGMSIESDGQGGFRMVQGPGAGGGGGNLTEQQSKDAVYATRARGSLGTIDRYGSYLTDPVERAKEYDPSGLVRGTQSPEFQMAKQAGEEFLNAILRKDTGAAITEQEMEIYGRNYLPMPGDTEEVLKQKQASRKRALEALQAGMSPQAILNVTNALRNTGDLPAEEEGDIPPAPPGVDPEDWKYMSPEDRALFQ